MAICFRSPLPSRLTSNHPTSTKCIEHPMEEGQFNKPKTKKEHFILAEEAIVM